MAAAHLGPHRVECLRLEEDIRYTEKAHFAAERRYRRTHYCVGVAAIIAAAVAAAAVLKDATVVTGVSALVAAVASGYQTFARPSELADQHLWAARDLGALRVRVRQALNLRLDDAMPEKEAVALLASFAQEKAGVDRGAPGLSERAFMKAQRKIKRGDFAHEVDSRMGAAAGSGE